MTGQNQLGKGSRRNSVALVAAAAMSSIAAAAFAADATWVPTTGTQSYNDGANWSGNGGNPPGAADMGIFDNEFSGTVTFSGSHTTRELSFRNDSGTIAFDLNGNSLTLGQTSTSTNGRITLGTANTQANTVTISDGSVLYQGAAGTKVLAIGETAGASGNTLTITGAGTNFTIVSGNVNLSATSTVGTGLGSQNNRLVVSDGAFYNIGNTLAVGRASDATNTGNEVEVTDATLLIPGGSRGLTVHPNNSVTITNGIVSAAASTFNPGSTLTFNSGMLGFRNTNYNTGSVLTVGDGGATPAALALIYSAPTLTTSNGIFLSSNGRLVGNNHHTTATPGSIIGNISGEAGAEVAPSIVNGANLAETSPFGRINTTGNWDNTDIEIILELGDFPTALATDTTPPFDPPVDQVMVSGVFTHGGSITIDLDGYVPPQDQDYVLKLVGWGSASGLSAATDVSFVNGAALAYEWRSDGLWVTAAVPEPASLGVLGLAACGLLARRRRSS